MILPLTVNCKSSERWFSKKFRKIDTADYWHSAVNMPAPPVPISPLSPQPSLPPAPAVSLASPLPALVLTFRQLHSALSTLATAALHHPYPLNVLLLNKVPPLTLPSLPLLLTPEKFHQHYYLHAYFQGWELYQTSCAAIVLFEHSGTVTIHTYGSLRDYYRQYPNSNDMMGCFLRTGFVWVRYINNSLNFDPGRRLGDKYKALLAEPSKELF